MKMNWFFWIQRIIVWFSDLLQYKRRYLELKLNNFEAPIDYSFIPEDWNIVRSEDIITGKVYDGAIQLRLDIRDLFNSTIYTRRWADAVLNEVGDMKAEESADEFFNRLALSAANLTLENIDYMTNQAQFSMADKWTNGDSAIETSKGDCFTGDTKVICQEKKTGKYAIKSFKELESSWKEYNALSVDIDTKEYKFKPIKEFINRGKKEVHNVRFRNGTSVKCTDTHSFPMVEGDIRYGLKIKKRKLKDIDLTKAYNRRVLFARKIPSLNFSTNKSNERLWLEGHYLAEGWSDKSHVCIAGDKPKQSILVRAYLNSEGIPFRDANRDIHNYVNIKQSEFKQFCKDNLGNNSLIKQVPQDYLSLSEEELILLLDGYIEGDTHVNKNPNYNFTLCHNTSSDKLVEQLNIMHLILGRPLYNWKCMNHGGVGKNHIWRLWERKDSTFNNEHFGEGFGYVTIRDIKPLSEEETFDMEVEDTHTFVLSNGVVAYNCDISVRVFVRTMYDVLARLNMWQYRKYVFQCVGFFSDVGHSWAMVYDPVDLKFKLVECTKDQRLSELPNMHSIYKLYFCFNYSKIFYQKDNWRIFL